MSFEHMSAVAGAIIALVFEFVPQLKAKYQALNGAGKRTVMILATLVVAIGLAAYAYGAPDLLERLLSKWGIGLGANQITFMLYRIVVWFVKERKSASYFADNLPK